MTDTYFLAHVLFFVAGAAAVALLLTLVHRVQASEARSRILAENAGDIVCLYDVNGRCLYVSPSIERVLGYRPPDCPRRHIHPDDEAHARRFFANISATPTMASFRVYKANGEVVWLEAMGRRVPGMCGRPEAIVTAARDVTDRKRVEDMYRALTDSLPNTSFFLYDRNLRILMAAGPFLALSGFSREAAEGRKLANVFGGLLDREQMAEAWGKWEAPLSGRSEVSEFPLRGAIYSFQFVPVATGDGVVAGIAVARDVTEQRRGEAVLIERTEDLERSNRDLEQFADIASHEMKTPLRHISGFVELLAEEYEGMLSDEADEYIVGVQQGVREMTAVIEALLRYSRAKSDENRMQVVNLEGLIRQVLASLEGRIQEVGGRVDVDWKSLPTVRGDPVLLKQLIENLVWNGLKFSQPGPVVRVSAARDLLDWVVTVEDNGYGVAEEHREMIFQMFKRSRTDVEGSGIGLALCKKIVSIHRGKIWVDTGSRTSGAGRPGAAFRFSLPAARSWDEITQH